MRISLSVVLLLGVVSLGVWIGADYEVVDLTHVISPGIPIWPGDPKPTIKPIATVEKDGYFLNEFSIGEHSGTHFGAPAHFVSGGKTVDEIQADLLIIPAVVIDISQKCRTNPDYALTVNDVLNWEKENGRIPSNSLVMAYTGWDEKWGDPKAFFGFDENGGMHFPGFSEEAVIFLMEKRGVKGLGIDTHGIDPGFDEEYKSNTALFERGGFHLENLANLGKLPPKGFYVFIGALPIKGGSGSPARVLALVPR